MKTLSQPSVPGGGAGLGSDWLHATLSMTKWKLTSSPGLRCAVTSICAAPGAVLQQIWSKLKLSEGMVTPFKVTPVIRAPPPVRQALQAPGCGVPTAPDAGV